MQVEGRVGEVRGAVGVQEPMRLGPYLEVMVSELQGRYFEMSRYNRIYHSTVKAVTVAATHNSPIAAVTATPVLGLLNPSGSGKAAVIHRIACSTVSGTPAGGQFVLNAIPAISTYPSTSQT